VTVWRSSFALSLFDLLYLQLQSPELSELLDLYTSFDAWSEGIAEAICSRFGKRTFHQLESLLSICGARAEHPSCGERQAGADRAKSLCRMSMWGRLLGVI